MCTINEDEEDEALMISEKSLSIVEKVCRSCGNAAKVVLRKKDAYCKNCFLSSSTHKFRATLGKSKLLKAGDNVLTVFTASHSSVALLHMLHTGLNENSTKRLVFRVDVLFIDDGIALGKNFEERNELVEETKKIATSFNFKMFVTTLSEILSEEPKVSESLIVDNHQDKQMKNIFEGVKSMTSKEDLLYQLRQKLAHRVAEKLQYHKIFTDEIGTVLAVKLLVGVSLGRGAQMGAEMGFCDSRNSDLLVLRPLKDFTHKEIIFYNVFNRLEPITISSFTTTLTPSVSIQKTAEKFINGLQEDFPSTVYTIFRTGEKLQIDTNKLNKNEKLCSLCGGLIKIYSSEEDYNAVEALDFSRKISEFPPSKKNTEAENHCRRGHSSCSSSQNNKYEEHFCYSCSLIFRDMVNKEELQNPLLSSATKDNLKLLKDQISEFLIE